MRLGPINPNDLAINVYRSLPVSIPFYLNCLRPFVGVTLRYIEGGVSVKLWKWRGKSYVVQTEYLGVDYDAISN
jgi:hypothetical protein